MNKGEPKMNQQEAKATLTVEVHRQVAMMEEYAKDKYGIPDFKVDVELKFNTYKSWGGTHNGGVPFVQLGMQWYMLAVPTDGNCDFPEYPSFAFDKVIGSLVNVHWKKSLSALVAHEIAHAIQFVSPLQVADILFSSRSEVNRKDLRGHKKLWRNIYKDLRIQFVNSTAKPANQAKTSLVTVEQPVEKVVAKPEVKVVVNTTKSWTTNKYRKDGGVVVEYLHIGTGNVMLKLFDRQNEPVLIFNPNTNKWENSGSTSRVEVRNRMLKLSAK